MIYSIEYSTENKYDNLSDVFLEYLITPENNTSQKILDCSIVTTPDAIYTINHNSYGFQKFTFNKLHQISRFKLSIKLTIEKKIEFPQLISPLTIEKEREILNSYAYMKNNYFYLKQTKFTGISLDQFNTNRPHREASVLTFCKALNEYLHHKIDYCTDSTTIETDAHTAFHLEKGVCQDYSHIFIGLARHEGIATRYVSGYLYVNDKTEAQLHAWVEVMIPQLGWVGFDPTNNLLINENYFKIAHGKDYSECAPVKGLVRGSEHNTTSYKVIIQQQQQ